ncbi:MAG: hypothetical protein FVQ80_03230 [Planctomycetes bacterium]|nr:hypothetical protein [Planctomycetota bacterium]
MKNEHKPLPNKQLQEFTPFPEPKNEPKTNPIYAHEAKRRAPMSFRDTASFGAQRFYGKQTQFTIQPDERKSCIEKGLWKCMPSQSLKNKPNQPPLVPIARFVLANLWGCLDLFSLSLPKGNLWGNKPNKRSDCRLCF